MGECEKEAIHKKCMYFNDSEEFDFECWWGECIPQMCDLYQPKGKDEIRVNISYESVEGDAPDVLARDVPLARVPEKLAELMREYCMEEDCSVFLEWVYINPVNPKNKTKGEEKSSPSQ